MRIVAVVLLALVLDGFILRFVVPVGSGLFSRLDTWVWRVQLRRWKRSGGSTFPLRWLGGLVQGAARIAPYVLFALGGWFSWFLLWR